LKDYIKPENQTVVQLSAEKSVRVGVIEDVRNELRRIGALKLQIRYYLPSDQDYMVPLPPTHTGKTKTGVTELLPGVDRENICIVRINSRDKVLFGNKATQDEEEMLRLGKGFLKEHGKDTRFSFQADRATSYGAYLHMQNLLIRIYTEVREETAQSVYGKSLKELSPEEKSQINWMVPLGISEAEMRGM
jgi:biopolymer transport protein ExbD